MHNAARTPLIGTAAAAALVLGAVGGLLLPVPPPWPVAICSLAAGFVFWWRRGAGWWAGALLAAASLSTLHAHYALSRQLPASLENRWVSVTGQIVELPLHDVRRSSFVLEVDGGSEPGLRGLLLRVGWYDHARDARRLRLRAGERWEAEVRVRAPRTLRNPGGSDGEKHALAQGLTATASVRGNHARLLTPAAGIGAWREEMSLRIARATPETSARFVRALALGDTRSLDDDDWHILRANGLTHLIAISGFHVGLVAGFFALMVRAAWWAFPALTRYWPAPVSAALAGVAGAFAYAVVAGFALPTVRTALMIGVVAAARLLRRPTSAAESLTFAAVAVVLVDPLALLGAGFWLSFAGVAWLVWCLPATRTSAPGGIARDFAAAQGVATLGLLPLGVLLFGQASLAGPVANLIAVPWWSLVVVPLSLAGLGLETIAQGAGGWAWRLAGACFDFSWPLFRWLSGSELALVWLPESKWFAAPLAIIGAFWCLLPRGLPGCGLALVLWLPLLWPDRGLPRSGEAQLTVIDVGQGLSVLVRTASGAVLYDMGPAVPEGFDAGERAVVPALRALGVRGVDRAIVSHGDNDHAGGLAAVRRAIPIRRLFAPDGSEVPGAAACVAGAGWVQDGVRFRFLHPTPYFPYLGNEASCVLRVETDHGVALLTGDIGEVIERELVRRDRGLLRANVVLIAHHGSGGSSDPAFVSATGARHALVSSGYGNRFRHPKDAVVQRWRDAGAQVHGTATGGALTVWLQPGGTRIETRREAQPRLWDAVARAARLSAGLSYRSE